MSSLDSIETTALRAEQSATCFANTLRELVKRTVPLENRFRPKISNDGAICVTLLLVNAKGNEAGLSVEPDFTSAGTFVYLLREDNSGDLCVDSLRGPNAVEKGMRLVLEHLSE